MQSGSERGGARAQVEWLLALTQLPTAAGREARVVEWVERWAAERPDLVLERDRAGNLVVRAHEHWGRRGAGEGPAGSGPVYFTAHLDHPAFVVERVVSPGVVELSFRGGVMEVFFESAPVVLHGRDGGCARARLIGAAPSASPAGKHYLAETERGAAPAIGDIATWDLPPAEIDSAGLLHTWGCDDLAGVAAALAAFDALRGIGAERGGEALLDVRLLFTRAEEIGFIGAIAACKLETMPRGSRVVALENSRAMADAPIGGGPIVRVGDRLSVFTPWLTNACAKRAEQITGVPAQPLSTQAGAGVTGAAGKAGWQRKLMPGGACEASVYCAYGYDATCLCLPLGNYHNMAHLAELQAGTYDRGALGPARAAREYISVADYRGMVELLVAIGQDLPREDPVMERVEKLYAEKGYVLGDSERR